MVDLIEVLVGKGNFNLIGIRPGEKLHEVMIPKEESLNCLDLGNYFIITPKFSWWDDKGFKANVGKKGKKVSESFEYSSDKNLDWISINQIRRLMSDLK